MKSFFRNCPECGNEIGYTNKYNYLKAEKMAKLCKSCGVKKSITSERLIAMKERVSGNKNPMYGMIGELNPFFGKHHTDESKNKMVLNKDYSKYHTKDFKNKISKLKKGKNNSMYGKTFYSIWVEKYGIDIANQKLDNFKKQQSINNKGSKNSMYGKTTPQGSGNGWSGWYNGWFFRSIKELTYMIKIIERFNLTWESAEQNKYLIRYRDYNNEIRTYRCDFIINNKYLVEIKPKNLFNSDNVKRKKIAAIDFCEKNSLKYKLTTIDNLSSQELINLYENNKIKFIDRYNKKFIERYLK